MKGAGEEDALTGEILAEIVVSENIPESKKLGEFVHRNLSGNLPEKYAMKDRGLKPGLFYVLAMTKVPGLLIEAGFISSKKDLSLLKKEEFLNNYANGVARGIREYLEDKQSKAAKVAR
jgi:N-acetylmuramoyl-L-alanine amidase